MKHFYPYFFKLSLICFSAIGAGLVTLYPSVIEHEKQAFHEVYQLELKTNTELVDNYTQMKDYQNCGSTGIHKAHCKYAKYLVSTVFAGIELFTSIYNLLLKIGLLSLILGLGSFAFAKTQTNQNL